MMIRVELHNWMQPLIAVNSRRLFFVLGDVANDPNTLAVLADDFLGSNKMFYCKLHRTVRPSGSECDACEAIQGSGVVTGYEFSMSTATVLAGDLLKENRETRRSWRQIAREDYAGKVPAGTLCRIAKSGGKWLPKNRETLALLGLRKTQDLFDMSTSALTAALKNRQPMPDPDPRIIDHFIRLGWMQRSEGV